MDEDEEEELEDEEELDDREFVSDDSGDEFDGNSDLEDFDGVEVSFNLIELYHISSCSY